MKLAKEIQAVAGNWPEWFRDQVVSLGEWRRGWPEGGVVVPPDVPPRRIRSTFWLPPRISIRADRTRGWRNPNQAFAVVLDGFKGKYAVRRMKAPEEDGKPQKSGNANFNQVIDEVLISCRGITNGLAEWSAQNSTLRNIRIKDPKKVGLYLGYGSRNVRLEGVDIDSEFELGMKERSKATGVWINGVAAQVTGTVNVYGTEIGIKVAKSRGVDLNVCAENVETAAVVDGKVTVPARGYGGKGVQTFQVRA